MLVLFLFGSTPSLAQSEARGSQPTVGLVLSGGSAKGLAHIGVLRVFEEEGIPVDVIAGTSMGSIVGGLYAIGYSAAELESIVTSQDWNRLFSDQTLRRNQRLETRAAGEGILFSLPIDGTTLKLPSGLISGQEILALFSRLTWPYQEVDNLARLPIPFAAVGTNLRTGNPVTLTHVSLPVAIRTSMSLPSLFAPVKIAGEWYIDGGLSRNLPAQEALDLGADVIIAVDVGDIVNAEPARDPSLVDVLIDASWFLGLKSDSEQRELVDVLIRPDTKDLSPLAFDRAHEWIDRGEIAARAALPALRALADSVGWSKGTRPKRTKPDLSPMRVERIEVTGVHGEAARIVERRLQLDVPGILGPDDVENAVSRVFGTGLFKLVSFRFILDNSGQRILRIDIIPQATPDRAGFGFRYDSEYNAGLLFGISLMNRLRFGSTTEFRLRLGEQMLLSGRYLARFGPKALWTTGAEFNHARAPVSLFLPSRYARAMGQRTDTPVSELRLGISRVSLFGGIAITEHMVAGITVSAEHIRTTETIAGVSPISGDSTRAGFLENQNSLTSGLVLASDSFDRLDFPTRGVRMLSEVRTGVSNARPLFVPPSTVDNPWFRYAHVDIEVYMPLHEHVSVFGRAQVAYGSGESLPINYHSFIGGVQTTNVLERGFLPLYGLDTQERFGRKAFTGSAGIQVTVCKLP